MLEEYIPGAEIDIDGWAIDGEVQLASCMCTLVLCSIVYAVYQVQFMLISDNNAAREPWFLELGGTYPSALPEATLESLRSLARDVVASFEGVIH